VRSQAGACHQRDRHGHLGDNERIVKTNRRSPRPGAGGSSAHRRDGRLPRTGERREDAEQHDRPERDGGRSGERRHVQLALDEVVTHGDQTAVNDFRDSEWSCAARAAIAATRVRPAAIVTPGARRAMA
jgi:hypothetical protein